MTNLIISFMAVSLSSFYLTSSQPELCTGVVTQNDMYIPVSSHFDENKEGITYEQFNDAIDRAEHVYTPIFSDLGKTLVIERKWDNGTVNATAAQKENIWKITMYGGLARHQATSFESFATVICHEIGHHLGGHPSHSYFMRKMSAEGQADYYATSKCMRKLFSHDENLETVKTIKLHKYPKALCDTAYSDENNIDRLANCYRSSLGGYNLSSLFRDIRLKGRDDVSNYFPLIWDAPDTKVTGSTFSGHAKPQCRLDTYMRGAACHLSHEDNFDLKTKDLKKGACYRGMDHDISEKLNRSIANTNVIEQDNNIIFPADINSRPLCWYKPGDARW